MKPRKPSRETDSANPGRLQRLVRLRRKPNNRESNFFYAIRIKKGRWPAFLARQHASAPALFWFHEDAVKYLAKCRKGGGCKCHKCEPVKTDIVKVFVSWLKNGETFNAPGDMFRSAKELKRKQPNAEFRNAASGAPGLDGGVQ